jgi:hypothetical protein
MKRPEVVLKEYCQKLSEENLKWIYNRVTQRLGGDIADVIEFVGNNREIDRWFQSVEDYQGLFNLIEEFAAAIQKEYEKRSLAA